MSETKSSRLLTEERRRAVLEMINRQGRVVISDLSRHFNVSSVTARADINALLKRDLLVRSHGGAIRKSEATVDYPLDVKASQHHDEKVRIGHAAAALVREGQTVLLDSGTTTLEVSRAIRNRKLSHVTLITNSLAIATELCNVSGINIIMIGGMLRRISRSFAGPQALKLLADLRVDHFFLGVDGLEPEIGPSTPDILEAELNAAMIRCAREVSVVTDSSKIGRSSLSLIAPITSIHRVITDSGITPEHRESLKSKGIDVVAVAKRSSG
ncbi:MAG TPA: DeoR/GlpR family DNA-binding transcription regulator [Bryobacteraceae bacterium]|jgi:DeoR family transcriptional regulator, aga operon transcriptional repressor|nr:DeoR/GlpR family DNA-binding transcription regulator [Bryobacteraceae bacterium]